ncbi:hypothetical protein [Absidia glauca]|uniref:Uncharacterized protein n=1 Tax=Absidia glauca TaxID=4829 RepID=A0A163M2N7_ABSGL|nr:hypothetical protein [Absidia glauca]
MTNTPAPLLSPRTSLTSTTVTPTTLSLLDSLQHDLLYTPSTIARTHNVRSPTSSLNGDYSLPPRRHCISVAEWMNSKGGKSKCEWVAVIKSSIYIIIVLPSVPSSHLARKPPVLSMNQGWKDVHWTIEQMDHLYDATFYSWLKSEDNVLVTAMYLHRIANEYSLDRLVNAVKWLVADWRWESTSILVRHITVGWCDEQGDIRRATLLRQLTLSKATHYTATLITTILANPPYVTAPSLHRERFLRAFNEGWGFSKLSEFFMYLTSQANIDHKLKCVMLQDAARREKETLGTQLNRRRRCHHYDDHDDANRAPSTAELSSTSATAPPSTRTTANTTDTTEEADCLLSNEDDRPSLGYHCHHHHRYHRRSEVPFGNHHMLERTTSTSRPQICPSATSSTFSSGGETEVPATTSAPPPQARFPASPKNMHITPIHDPHHQHTINQDQIPSTASCPHQGPSTPPHMHSLCYHYHHHIIPFIHRSTIAEDDRERQLQYLAVSSGFELTLH